MGEQDRLQEHLREVEGELARCRRLRAFGGRVDRALEDALQARRPLEHTLPPLLALVMDELGGVGAVAYTLNETLAEELFTHGDVDPEFPVRGFVEAADSDGRWALDGGRHGVAARLDVGTESLGAIGAVFTGEPPEEARAVLDVLAEHLDNHLAAIAHARERYELIRDLSTALRDPVLERGLDRAIEILRKTVAIQHLVLLFRHEDDLQAGGLRYKVFLDGEPAHDSSRPFDEEVDSMLRAEAASFLRGDDRAVREKFGISRFREEVLISGVRTERVIGRMLATSAHGEFHTLDRELLDRFADTLRQRIVDFNREWKALSAIFPDAVCERLLREEGYVERYLTPRDAHAAILFADISGFTRLSEQVLGTPEAVGRLIHTWAERVVDTVWETGGVFDKMVGDCVIGFWGPPFFELRPDDCCRRALRAARRIREFTRSLSSHPKLPELHGLKTPPDVAIGVHYAQLSVGLFGPNDDYTGFSSGMNNTARLQGIAKGGEILCMEALVDTLGDERDDFGPIRSAAVKNVKEPLRFRVLRG